MAKKKEETADERPIAVEEPAEIKQQSAAVSGACCGTCRFRLADGKCHFLPKTVVSAVFSTWAPVDGDDWCGQWETRKA